MSLPKVSAIPSERRSSGFFVVGREFGKEVRLNSKPLSRSEALSFGRDVTKQSISASFKVVKQNPYWLQASKRTRFATGAGVSSFNFAEGRSVKTKGFSVEKTKYRISSPGAKIELKQAKNRMGGLLL
jgi:hypothetical protein